MGVGLGQSCIQVLLASRSTLFFCIQPKYYVGRGSARLGATIVRNGWKSNIPIQRALTRAGHNQLMPTFACIAFNVYNISSSSDCPYKHTVHVVAEHDLTSIDLIFKTPSKSTSHWAQTWTLQPQGKTRLPFVRFPSLI